MKIHWFYRAPNERFRYHSWNMLPLLGHGPNAPWLAVENFNKIAYSFEKRRG